LSDGWRVSSGKWSSDPNSLGFGEEQTPYDSPSQNARAWTEAWAVEWLFCPACGNDTIEQSSPNQPVFDFYCSICREQFELKSKKGKFGGKVVDGAYRTMCERLSSDNNPNFAFLQYSLERRRVLNLFVVPKQFLVPEIIEERLPLPVTARRAGWVGCNIRLKEVPLLGRVDMVRAEQPVPKEVVLEQWQKSLFLRDKSVEARGWLVEVMACCDAIGKRDFHLDEVYAFESKLSSIYPGNQNVRPKIRQQLQVLRDAGYLEFIGRGFYRLR